MALRLGAEGRALPGVRSVRTLEEETLIVALRFDRIDAPMPTLSADETVVTDKVPVHKVAGACEAINAKGRPLSPGLLARVQSDREVLPEDQADPESHRAPAVSDRRRSPKRGEASRQTNA